MSNCPALTKITADTIAITKDLISELQVSTYNTSPGTVVDVQCQFGFDLDGPSTVTCGNNGQWSGTPTCNEPAATRTTNDDSSGLDESMIILIVLIVVVVFVVAVIILICVALYYGKIQRKKEKGKAVASIYGENSLPYTNSISEPYPVESNNVAMYNFYTGNGQYDNKGYRNYGSDKTAESYYRTDSDNRNENYRQSKHYRYYRSYDDLHDDRNIPYHDNYGYRHSDTDRNVYYLPYIGDDLAGKKNNRHFYSFDDLHSDRNFRFHDLHVDEPTENHVKRYRDEDYHFHHHHHHQQPNVSERLYEKNPKVSRSPQAKKRRFVSRCPHCSNETEMKHAKSADDISSQRDDRKERQYFRRDSYLWRSMNAIHNNKNWNIPRPYYGN